MCETGVLAGDGYIYAVNDSGQVLKVDTTINNYTWIGDPIYSGNGAGWGVGWEQGWGDPIVGVDKCIYWPPRSANRVRKFDPKTQKLPSLVGDDLGGGAFKWWSGALASNGTNECAIRNGSNKCSLENQFFAAVAGTGSSCSNSGNMGVTSTPPGCGCDPSRAAPCSFDPSLQHSDLSCFMCSAKDLADGVCARYTLCLGSKNNCINTSQTEEAYKSCLALISDTDRNNCHDQCTKW
jgi:hypothetical protein